MSTNKTQNIPLHSFTRKDFAFDISVLSEYNDMMKGKGKKPHRHTYYEIFIFTKGGGSHMIDFVNYPIVANSLHFISPGMVHIVQRNAACTGYVITFPEEFFGLVKRQDFLHQINLYNQYRQTPVIKCNKLSIQKILQSVKEILHEYNGNGVLREELIRAYLSILLIDAERLLSVTEVVSEQKQVVHNRVKTFRKLVEDYFLEWRSVSEYAAKLNLTSKTLTQFIKKNTGLTPIEHINNRVLIEGKRLLMNTDLSVKEISFSLSFDDPAYFGRFFKRHEKTTPQLFRQHMRKKYHNK
ncbi:MAG: helix-turn-helix domain-containing protein [Bacteroidia bacterium]|nr:helix-turn-helix domain-containing protein [Bacteroidia bacterium]